MGYIPTEEGKRMEVEELKRMMLGAGLINSSERKEHEREDLNRAKDAPSFLEDGTEKVVCVTSGVSFLGLAIVNRLLSRGYSVRIIVHNQEDIEKLRELESSGEMMRSSGNGTRAVLAKPCEVESLMGAFEGCRGVFHTAGFTDPAGLSGYTKSMAEIEVKASENVIEACSRTPSVRNCVLTSSLLACLWRDGTSTDLSPVINHESWSDESLCIQKKLWYALGKLRAEKAAWTIAEEKGLKLATICPALVVGPDFLRINPTATMAYLKGAQEMFGSGLLATVDVMKLAEAHICVYEAMNRTAFGRYICYDRVIESPLQAENLAKQTGLPPSKICGDVTNDVPARYQLSDTKLCTLMSRTLRDCYNLR